MTNQEKHLQIVSQSVDLSNTQKGFYKLRKKDKNQTAKNMKKQFIKKGHPQNDETAYFQSSKDKLKLSLYACLIT